SLPLWLLIGAMIRLTSRGSALYAGTRIGRDGHPFRMYKFRTMHANADQSGPAITGAADARITPLGHLLRTTKLDELPQLLNVLRGEMSLVGPRPESPAYVALYDDRQRVVLTVRPGITGPSQLLYRHEQELLSGEDVERQYRDEILPAKLESDLAYVRDRSLAKDVHLLWLTVHRLWTRRTTVTVRRERSGDVRVARL
ncbi:MAG: sugar transferase, partial [Chloroflexota bacterium]